MRSRLACLLVPLAAGSGWREAVYIVGFWRSTRGGSIAVRTREEVATFEATWFLDELADALGTAEKETVLLLLRNPSALDTAAPNIDVGKWLDMVAGVLSRHAERVVEDVAPSSYNFKKEPIYVRAVLDPHGKNHVLEVVHWKSGGKKVVIASREAKYGRVLGEDESVDDLLDWLENAVTDYFKKGVAVGEAAVVIEPGDKLKSVTVDPYNNEISVELSQQPFTKITIRNVGDFVEIEETVTDPKWNPSGEPCLVIRIPPKYLKHVLGL